MKTRQQGALLPTFQNEREGGEGGDRFHVNALLSGVLKAWFVWYYL